MPALYILVIFGVILGVAAIHDVIYNRQRRNLIDSEREKQIIYYRYGFKD